MNARQRTTHRWVWLILAPALLTFAIMILVNRVSVPNENATASTDKVPNPAGTPQRESR